jgi:hypothetical protein
MSSPYFPGFIATMIAGRTSRDCSVAPSEQDHQHKLLFVPEDDNDDDDAFDFHSQKLKTSIAKSSTEQHKTIKLFGQNATVLNGKSKDAQDELNEHNIEYKKNKAARRELELAGRRAKYLEDSSKENKMAASEIVEGLKDDMKEAAYERRVAELALSTDVGKPYAMWSLEEIRTHRDMKQQEKWDALKQETPTCFRNNHTNPMASMGIRANKAVKDGTFSVFPGRQEGMPAYVRRIQGVLG